MKSVAPALPEAIKGLRYAPIPCGDSPQGCP